VPHPPSRRTALLRLPAALALLGLLSGGCRPAPAGARPAAMPTAAAPRPAPSRAGARDSGGGEVRP